MFAPGEQGPCAGCAREFAVNRRMFIERRVSVGLLPRAGVDGYRARISLYRGAGGALTVPRPTSTVSYVVALPVVPAEGIVSAHVVLETGDLSQPRGTLDAPITVKPGAPATSVVDTWAREQRRSCDGAPREGEVCVPGGAFWMGDLTASIPAEKLVVVSPFFLDATEVTVRRMRASPLSVAAVRDGGIEPTQPGKAAYCTFSRTPGANEDFPVTCVQRSFAQIFCGENGGRLPTEGELAFVMSGRVGAPFVWGDEPPACGEAVFGRAEPGGTPGQRACSSTGTGPAKVATSPRDVLTLRSGRIFDLSGSVAEWAADDYALLDSDCWNATVLVDPRCQRPDKAPTFRGGAWNSPGPALTAVTRGKLDAIGPDLGFRCAR
jgi:formylglycine-generating enzyme required for sulfatase activity